MKPLSIILTSLIAIPVAVEACDLCGCATVRHYDFLPTSGFYTGANEQFTRFKTLQQDGQTIDNDARQKLDSSITQIFLGYNITPSVGVQVNVPFIRRTFRRTQETTIDSGSVGGIGDVSVLANWLPIFHRSESLTYSLKITGGVKFPTGDSSRVKEEGAEGHTHGSSSDEHASTGHEHAMGEEHHAEGAGTEETDVAEEPAAPALPESGIHGHDLALGTGSFDGVVGGGAYVRWERLFLEGEVQYAIRGQGRYDYDFANDLTWSGGLGVYLIDRQTHRVAVEFVCAGETKGEDQFRGQRSDDTSTTNVYLGPKVSASFRNRFSAEVALDVPVLRENSGVQIVPTYRLHAAVGWTF